MTRRVKTLMPIHPNAGVHAWYLTELDGLLRPAYIELSAVLVTAYPRKPVLAQDAAPVPTLTRAMAAWAKKWGARMDATATLTAKKFASKNFAVTETQMRAALKAAGFTVTFKPTKQSIAAYQAVVAENVNLIRSISQQYLTQVQTLVMQSVQKGSDMSTLSTKLQKQYGISQKRAGLISRDQNNKAKATIENARRQQLGIKQAIWQHSAGGKEPRPEHVKWGREGAVFNVDKGLYDDDAGEWVLPGQLINCRCTSRAIIEGFNDD